MGHRTAGRIAVLGLAATSAGLSGFSGPPAMLATDPPTATLITVASESGEYVGQGQPLVITEDGTTFVTHSSPTFVMIEARNPNFLTPATFAFESPDGLPLRHGLYVDPAGGPGSNFQPGINVSLDARTCNDPNGRFEIRDLEIQDESVVRLWVAFQQRCDQGRHFIFGEIRYNMPERDGVLAPEALWWPDLDQHRPGAIGLVTLRPLEGLVTVDAVSLRGPGAPAFNIITDTCSGARVSPGEACEIAIQFLPTTRGAHIAWVEVDGSNPIRASLTGASPQTRSTWRMDSPGGDFVGQGRSYAWTTADAYISSSGNRFTAHIAVEPDDEDGFRASFTGPGSDPLTVRRYDNVVRCCGLVPEPGLIVSGQGRGCNQITGWFEVTSIAWRSDQTLTRFAAKFSQSCDGDPPLTGSIEWQIPEGDVTGPAMPSFVSASRAEGSVSLSWEASDPTDVVDFAVRALPGEVPPALVTTGIHGYAGPETSATISVSDGGSTALAVFAVDSSGNASRPDVVIVPPLGEPFADTANSAFATQIRWLAEAGITQGCDLFLFCPNRSVSRGQMASFLARAFSLAPTTTDFFVDDDGSTHESDINRVRAAGIAFGCGAGLFCPTQPVKRSQMAAFLDRALGLPSASQDYFLDDDGLTLEPAINAVRESQIAFGCATDRFCPRDPVTREQMAAFLYRALGP